MVEKKGNKQAPARKTTKASVAQKTVKKTANTKATNKLAIPKKERIQTAEGWKRARLKKQASKAK